MRTNIFDYPRNDDHLKPERSVQINLHKIFFLPKTGSS